MSIIFSTVNKIIGRKTGQVLSLAVTETPVVVGGTSVPTIDNDLKFNAITGGTISQNFEITANALTDNADLGLKSSDISIASTNGNKVIDEGAGGSASIYISRYGYSQQKIDRDYNNPPGTVNDSTGYVSGTLGAHILTAMTTLINGLTQSNSIQQYLTSNNADVNNPQVTVNPNIFTGALDFSGISVIRTNKIDDRFPLALVTTRHALIAKHVRPVVGDEFIFHRIDGTYQKVGVVGVYSVTDGNDLAVVYLDAAITGITPYKTMPYDWQITYTPSTSESGNAGYVGIIPLLRKTMHSSIDNIWGSYILINNVINVFGTGMTLLNTRSIAQTGEIPSQWGEGQAIGGDSGGPSFLVINNELILICSQTNVTGAANIANYTTEIETAMDTLAGSATGTWKLQHPNLTAFTVY